MARLSTIVLSVLLLGLAATALGLRTSIKVDVSGQASPKTTWEKCHDVMKGKWHAFRHAVPNLPKGLREFVAPAQGLNGAQTFGETKEGIACTWQEILPGMDWCVTNWKQLNKTLTPANDVARASANLNAKAYVCGLSSVETSCNAINHCAWNDQFNFCGLSSFYFSLVFACRGSPVRDVSICIDHSAQACNADARCKWHGGPANVCLPPSVPSDWSVEQIEEWLMNLFGAYDEPTFLANWGDCATSHAWLKLTECGQHSTETACNKDDLCAWSDIVDMCTIKIDKFEDIMWGGDTKTIDAINRRAVYCSKFYSEDACVRAMANSAVTRV